MIDYCYIRGVKIHQRCVIVLNQRSVYQQSLVGLYEWEGLICIKKLVMLRGGVILVLTTFLNLEITKSVEQALNNNSSCYMI